MVRIGLRLAVVLACVIALLSSCSGSPSNTAVDNRLLTNPYELLDGGSSSLAVHLGTPMLVNFFASWCAPCVAEMPDLELLHQQYGERVVFIGMDTQEKAEDGRKIVAKTGVTYAIGRDPEGALFTAFGGLGMPTTILIRADGTVADRHSGALNADTLRAMIQKAFF